MNQSPDSAYSLKDVDKVLIEGVKEIVGPEGVRDLFARSRSLSAARESPTIPTLDNLQRALNERFGRLGGQGLALRSGRAAFRRGLKVWGEAIGITGNTYRLLPFSKRIRTGLEKVGGLLAQHGQAGAQVSEDEQHWFLRLEDCPTCGAQSDYPACHLVIGVLQEYMTWAASGRFFHVTETACISAGAPACLFQIDKAPIE